jgi:hypothetical protein
MSTTPDRPADAPWPLARLAWLRDPAARNYLFVGLASLLVVAAALFFLHGHPLAALPVAVAALGLLLRSPVMPCLFLVALAATAVPTWAWMNPKPYSDVPLSHFRLMDLVLVGAALTYFVCQYRLLSLAAQGMPPDTPAGQRRKADKPPRRPGHLVPPEEMGRMFAGIVACVVIGQVAWLLIGELRLDFSAFPPLRLPAPSALLPQSGAHYDRSAWVTRFLLAAGLIAGAVLPAALVFWYWRLTRLGAGEARMVLLDTQWREARRELNRQEKWRAWGLSRRRPKRAAERRKPTGPRRSFWEALGLTCGMVFVGGIVAVVAVIALVRWATTQTGGR